MPGAMEAFVPACGTMTNTSSQGSLGGSDVKIQWSASSGVRNMSPDLANDRMPIPFSGVYRISAAVMTGFTGRVDLSVYVNGSVVHRQRENTSGLAATNTLVVQLDLAAGDYVEIFYGDSSGGSAQSTTVAAELWPRVDISRVG